ncbi:MAG: hypothetical protein FWD71_02795 [Oscillospiraceae bacterium]|nr:hypothetical protein [Oscillospiraceae bacterium]
MRNFKVKYSCLADNHERYQKQGWLWLNSLIYFGKINPSDIFVHCIAGTGEDYINKCAQTGANVVIIEPYGDKTYCNKIAQMSDDKLKDSDAVILMDTDMIMLENFENTLDYEYISAKIVNSPNPETHVIDKLFGAAGLKKSLPDKTVELMDDYLTYGANFNGGLYVIPQKYYDIIKSGWEKWSQWLLMRENGKPLYDAKREAHIDQVSFCMTVHENNIPVKYLNRLYNYPIPFDFSERDKSENIDGTPYVLHCHRQTVENNLIILDYQPAENIIKAVDSANKFIEKYNKI